MARRRRNDGNPYGVSESGDGLSAPDYSNFKLICREIGKELGMDGKDVYRIYGSFIDRSLSMLFPEDNPREIQEQELLTPRRAMLIPYIGAAEVTRKSVLRFRKIKQAIEESRNKKH